MVQHLVRRLFDDLAVSTRYEAAAAAGEALAAFAVHVTAFSLADERIVDLLRAPGPASPGEGLQS